MKKAYTKAGDLGFTKDFSGKELSKDSLLVVVEGKIDSLQSVIDLAVLEDEKDKEILEEVQEKLSLIAGRICKASEYYLTEEDLKKIESFIDSLGEPPKEFIRFRNKRAIVLNECRVRCRELESHIVKLLKSQKQEESILAYVNRLSSLFFMMAYGEK